MDPNAKCYGPCYDSFSAHPAGRFQRRHKSSERNFRTIESISPLPDTMPFLQEFLADSTILKAGVGVNQDMLELYRWEQTSMMFDWHLLLE
jgi:hypothetical protein